MRNRYKTAARLGLALGLAVLISGSGYTQEKDYNKFVHKILPNGLDLIIQVISCHQIGEIGQNCLTHR